MDPVGEQQDQFAVVLIERPGVLVEEIDSRDKIGVLSQGFQEQDPVDHRGNIGTILDLQPDLLLGRIGKAQQVKRVSGVEPVFQQVPQKVIHHVVEHGEHAFRCIHHDDNVDARRPGRGGDNHQGNSEYQRFEFHDLVTGQRDDFNSLDPVLEVLIADLEAQPIPGLVIHQLGAEG